MIFRSQWQAQNSVSTLAGQNPYNSLPRVHLLSSFQAQLPSSSTLQYLTDLALSMNACSVASVMSNSWRPCGLYSPLDSSVHGILQQEYWSSLPCSPPGNLPSPRIEPTSPTSLALQEDSLLLSHCRSSTAMHMLVFIRSLKGILLQISVVSSFIFHLFVLVGG